MGSKAQHDGGRTKAIAVTRKLAKAWSVGGPQKIGPEYLAVGMLKAIEPSADDLLADFGIPDVAAALKHVPDASPEEMDSLPAAEPDQLLANLLSGALRPFIEGKSDTVSALRDLLADPAVVAALARLVAQLQHGPPQTDSYPSVAELVRTLTRNLQTGYLLGRTYYVAGARMTLPAYASGKNAGVFGKAVREFAEERQKVRMAMYAGKRGRRSVFDRYMREYGPLSADVAFAVMINALTPFTESGGPISVRETAWAIDPRRYHVIVGDVIDAVKSLKQNNLVRILPEEDQCQLFSVLLPSEQLMDDFNAYISQNHDVLADLSGS